MKKLLSLLLIFIFFIFLCISCNNDSSDSLITGKPSEPIVNNTSFITINRPPVGDFIQYSDVTDWQKLINERYDIDITLNYISPLYQSAIATGDYYPQAIIDNKISGLIELNVSDYRNLAVLMEKGLILPLDEFLIDNEIFHSLSPLIKESFKMDDGNIWAITANSIPGVGIRGFKTSWLESLNISAPKTIDELYAVSKAFAYDDPNGNGKADEHGMDINMRTGARMLYDVFLSNECYISNYGACSIGYDYTTGAYEDSALKPGMSDTLNFIQSLHDEGILYMSVAWEFLEREGFGNFYDFSNFLAWDLNRDEWTQVYNYNENLVKSAIALKPTKCFVMTTNTESPSDTINSFVNTFFGDVEGMALGSFGLPNIDFTIDGNILTHIYEYKSISGQSNFYSDNIWLTGLNYDLIEKSGIQLESSYYTQQSLDKHIKQEAVLRELSMNNMLFSDSFFLPHQDYKTVQTSFAHALVSSFLFEIDTISPGDFIQNYIESQKKSGADIILNEVNEKFDFSSTYHY